MIFKLFRKKEKWFFFSHWNLSRTCVNKCPIKIYSELHWGGFRFCFLTMPDFYTPLKLNNVANLIFQMFHVEPVQERKQKRMEKTTPQSTNTWLRWGRVQHKLPKVDCVNTPAVNVCVSLRPSGGVCVYTAYSVYIYIYYGSVRHRQPWQISTSCL